MRRRDGNLCRHTDNVQQHRREHRVQMQKMRLHPNGYDPDPLVELSLFDKATRILTGSSQNHDLAFTLLASRFAWRRASRWDPGSNVVAPTQGAMPCRSEPSCSSSWSSR